MQPVAFDLARPGSVAEALALLAEAGPEAQVMAGGQSLGPMLNLRLARPRLVVDISGIPELATAEERDGAAVYGACVTHAAIEDGRVPDPTRGFLRRVAGGIAYRAVRNRGTVGGSLVHADPSADWLTVLTALGATLEIRGPGGTRRAALADFPLMPYTVALEAGELVTAVHVPALSPGARVGYHKFCRKRGEFAEAMAAVVIDPARGVARAVIGATDGRPVVVELAGDAAAAGCAAPAGLREQIADLPVAQEPWRRRMQTGALMRAMQEARP